MVNRGVNISNDRGFSVFVRDRILTDPASRVRGLASNP